MASTFFGQKSDDAVPLPEKPIPLAGGSNDTSPAVLSPIPRRAKPGRVLGRAPRSKVLNDSVHGHIELPGYLGNALLLYVRGVVLSVALCVCVCVCVCE
jgi:hypothetical protein